jgi:hypothetical protein
MQTYPHDRFTPYRLRQAPSGRQVDPTARPVPPTRRVPVATPDWLDPDASERAHFTSGWRAGVRSGLVAGIFIGALSLAGALRLGMWVGA